MSDVYVCTYNHAKLGGCGGMLPQEIFRESDALRLFLWDGSSAVVAVYATWLGCPLYAFAKPADIEFS